MTAFNIRALKVQTRRAVHDTFAVPATYTDSEVTSPAPITVRHHSRVIRQGNLDTAGYAEVLAGLDRLIFDHGELRALSLVLTHGGEVNIPFPDGSGSVTFILDTEDPRDGPVTVAWNVALKS